MKKYKIETHLHTNHVSKCGRLDADTLTQAYKQAGYDAIIVTDHYNRTTFEYLDISTKDPFALDAFLGGFHRMTAAAKDTGLRIFRGAELRFDESENDYLLYGYCDELLAEPEKIFRMGITDFSKLAHSQGALIVQAHPYRSKCTPAIACYLDGIETINHNPRHESFNERAAEYAEQFGLLSLSGSDCHRTEDIARGGIITDHLPSDHLGMMRLIRSRHYELI